jgi:hypothetical protein
MLVGLPIKGELIPVDGLLGPILAHAHGNSWLSDAPPTSQVGRPFPNNNTTTPNGTLSFA